MPRNSDLVRTAGWPLGSIGRPADNRALLAASVDRGPEPGESIVRVVAVTQDYDPVQEPYIEPFVEFIDRGGGTVVSAGVWSLPVYFRTVGEDGTRPWFRVPIHNRFRAGKKTLIGNAVDRDVRRKPDSTRLLNHWVAKRYTRPALFDAFNFRPDAVNRRLERLFKNPEKADHGPERGARHSDG